MRVVIESTAGRSDALYRLNFGAQHMVTDTTLHVVEALGTSPRALAAIWRYLLGIDWSPGSKRTGSARPSALPLAA